MIILYPLGTSPLLAHNDTMISPHNQAITRQPVIASSRYLDWECTLQLLPVVVVSDLNLKEVEEGIESIDRVNDEICSPLFPPELWAMILDNLPYDSLLSCASTCRMMLHDVLPLVKTLQIDRPSQLRAGMITNSLRDVQCIYINCLFNTAQMPPVSIKVSHDTVTKLVPFLCCFSKLELDRVYLRGNAFYNTIGHINSTYMSELLGAADCVSLEHLMDALSGGFDCGILPESLEIIGLRCPRSIPFRSGCNACRRVCEKFPIQNALAVDLCLEVSESRTIIGNRQGGNEYLLSDKIISQLLAKCYPWNAPIGRPPYWMIYEEGILDELTYLSSAAVFDSTKLNEEEVVSAITTSLKSVCHPTMANIYIDEQTFDSLKRTGLPIPNDLLDPDAIRVENLNRFVTGLIEGGPIWTKLDKCLKPLVPEIIRCLRSIGDLVSRAKDPVIQQVVDSGVLQTIVECLSRDDYPDLQRCALRAIIIITNSDDKQTQFVIDHNVLPCLLALLSSKNETLVKQCCFAISNILSGTQSQAQAVVEYGIIPPLIELLKNSPCIDIRSGAAFAIKILAGRGKPKHIKLIVQLGCIRPLCEMLTVEYNDGRPDVQAIWDSKVVGQAALNALSDILTHSTDEIHAIARTLIMQAGGHEKMKELKHHNDNEIQDLSSSIIELYFDVE